MSVLALIDEPLCESHRGSFTKVGTYSSNTTINVSSYSPSSVNDFVMTVTNVTYSGGLTWGKWDTSAIGYGASVGTTVSPTMSLAGNNLTISNLVNSVTQNHESSQYGDTTWTGTCTLTVVIYFIG